MRKNPHRNHGPRVPARQPDGTYKMVRWTRRAHGLRRDVALTPSTRASAAKRAYEYAHSAERRRLDPARWAA